MGESCTSRKLKPALGTRTRINVNVALTSLIVFYRARSWTPAGSVWRCVLLFRDLVENVDTDGRRTPGTGFDHTRRKPVDHRLAPCCPAVMSCGS